MLLAAPVSDTACVSLYVPPTMIANCPVLATENAELVDKPRPLALPPVICTILFAAIVVAPLYELAPLSFRTPVLVCE